MDRASKVAKIIRILGKPILRVRLGDAWSPRVAIMIEFVLYAIVAFDFCKIIGILEISILRVRLGDGWSPRVAIMIEFALYAYNCV